MSDLIEDGEQVKTNMTRKKRYQIGRNYNFLNEDKEV